MKFVLRPYQEQAIRRVYARLAEGRRAPLLVAPTGAGKTVMAARIIEDFARRGIRTLFVAHRTELIEQPSRKLDECGIEHGIIKAGLDRGTRREMVQVASVQTYVAREKYLKHNFGLIIIDECFPAGTMVDGMPIEQINPGDSVYSYNHAQEHIQSRLVTKTFKSVPNNLIRVWLKDGTSLVCTPGHPVWSNGRYAPASELVAGNLLWRVISDEAQEVRRVRDGIRAAFMEPDDDSDLLPGVQIEAAREAGKGCSHGLRAVRQVRRVQRPEGSGPSKKGKGLLLGRLSGALYFFFKFRTNEANKHAACFGADEKEQPHEVSGVKGQGLKHDEENGLEASCSGREWDRPNKAATAALHASRMDHGASNQDRQEARIGHPVCLQSRHCEPGVENRYRGRWEQPQVTRPERRGPQAGLGFEGIGVDRIEVLEPGCDGKFGELCPDGFVYNLEVDGNHNYFADGLLVHNCHHAASDTYQRVLDANGRPPVIGLTATPYRTDGKGLCDVFDALEMVTTTAQLMREGFLVPVKLYRGTLPIELRGIKTVAGDYDEGELGAAMARPKLIGHALAEYTRLAYGRRAIGFCVNVAHSKACAEAFNAAGIVAEHIDGMMARTERAAILRRYHEGRTLVVFNCGVLTEGYDESRIEAVLGLRPTKSRGLWRQIVGRGLRLCPELGKQHCAILDHANWTAEHGYLTDPDDVSLAAGIQRGQQRGEYEREEATGTEDTIGLGDARVSLAEDPLAFIQGPRISTALPPPIVRPPASKPQIMRRFR